MNMQVPDKKTVAIEALFPLDFKHAFPVEFSWHAPSWGIQLFSLFTFVARMV